MICSHPIITAWKRALLYWNSCTERSTGSIITRSFINQLMESFSNLAASHLSTSLQPFHSLFCQCHNVPQVLVLSAPLLTLRHGGVWGKCRISLWPPVSGLLMMLYHRNQCSLIHTAQEPGLRLLPAARCLPLGGGVHVWAHPERHPHEHALTVPARRCPVSWFWIWPSVRVTWQV